MLSPDDIRRLCERKYPAFLRSEVTGEPFFPLRIRFGRPSSTDEWEKLQSEITALAQAGLGYEIEWIETNTRRWGTQRLPDRVYFESELEFLQLLRKQAEVERFRRNVLHTREVCPELAEWLPDNVLRVIEFAEVWPDLLKVCRYFLAHPRPSQYARQLPIDVHTKFIEGHRGILRSMLDFVLPSGTIVDTSHFEERFGLRYEEPQIRFRLLDPGLKSALSLPVDDLSVPLSQFRALRWSDLTVLVVENKMTFLTLPALPNTIGVFGGGGAAELLASVGWLIGCPLYYWGDLDVHGYHIVSRLRRTFPGLLTLMMDEETLHRFITPGSMGLPASYEDSEWLTAQELRVYEKVKAGNLLLEQEKVEYAHATERLRAALGE